MSRMGLGLVSLIGMLVLMWSAPASAQDKCDLVVDTSATTWTLVYDPLQDQGAMQEFDLILRNVGDTPCNLFSQVELIADSFGLLRQGGIERLDYVLMDELANRDISPRAGVSPSRGGRPFQLAAGEQGLMRFSFQISPDDIPLSGLYTQDVMINLVDATGRERQKQIRLVADVIATALIGLKGEFQRTGTTAIIDLGALTEGPRPLMTTLYVQSSAGYVVTVSSENLGQMRQGSTAWYIPYSLAIGDRVVNLDTPGQVVEHSTRPRFDNYPLSINIGSTTGKRAGSYRDTLIFTVAAI